MVDVYPQLDGLPFNRHPDGLYGTTVGVCPQLDDLLWYHNGGGISTGSLR